MSTSGGGGYLLHAIKVYVPSLVHITNPIYSLLSTITRYDDPSAEPVAAHRRPKAAKQTAESSQEQFEDSTTQASLIETDDVHHTELSVDG
jgi:hypothetical protein